MKKNSHDRAWELGELEAQKREEKARELEKDSFLKHLSVAKKQIDAIGYHLRDKSVLELEKLTF